MSKRILIALGGNAIISAKHKGTYQEQLQNIRQTAEQLAGLVQAGHQLIITHGNGPQVGNLLIQHDAGKDKVPALPLDVCGAQSQGQIGYLFQQQLQNVLNGKHKLARVATVVTQVLVDPQDPAFQNPSKPVGPFYDRAWAEQAKAQGVSVVEDAGRGYRKVVASPKPLEIVELDTIKTLIANQTLVITAGGGGVPVVKDEFGNLQGVEAVIDKDRTGALLAQKLQADIFMILTDVNQVAINFNTPTQENLGQVSVAQMKTYLKEGHFAKGSMAPKVEAGIEFVEATGGTAIITHPTKALEAIAGNAGTYFTK